MCLRARRTALRCRTALLVAGVMAVTAVGAAAQTTANLTVTATVIANCTVSTGTVAFGDYDPTASAAVDASGTFNVACTQGTLATVGLGAGQNALAGARRLLSGTSYLTYELYKDAARSAVWGAAGGATLALASAPSNAARTVTVYGRVAGAQNVPTGAYGDTVVISVTF